MSRLAYPLVLLAALAAGRARAQDGDRYGPRPAPYAGPASPQGAPARAGYDPTLRPAAPMLRSLSWPGKAELRPALAPAGRGPAAAPTPASYALRSAPTPTGRFPGMSAYASPPPAPALRPAEAPYANVPSPSTTWPAQSRAVRRRSPASQAYGAPQPIRLPSAEEAAPTRAAAQTSGSNLPAGLAAPPSYVPPGPAYGPALAAQARDQAQAAASTADTLPPPTVGRYGYVGPGRTPASPVLAYPRAAAPAYPQPVAPASSAAESAATGGLGPPRPPAYARGYVLPPQPAAGAPAVTLPAPGANGATAARTPDGVRRYSVHREYGMEPDPLPVPPQFFAATPDLSAPETEPAAPRASKAAVNAAQLAASGG